MKIALDKIIAPPDVALPALKVRDTPDATTDRIVRSLWQRQILNAMAAHWPQAVERLGKIINNPLDPDHFEAIKLVINKLVRDEDIDRTGLADGIRVTFCVVNAQGQIATDERGRVINGETVVITKEKADG